MTYAEVEARLKTSHSAVLRLVRARDIEVVQIRGARRVLASSVDAYVRRLIPPGTE